MTDTYVVHASQTVTYRATVKAESKEEAVKLAMYGIGDSADPEPHDLEIVSVLSTEQ